MKIKLNGQDKEFSTSLPLQEIVSQFCADSRRVIAEVNGAIVNRSDWNRKVITEGDNIEIVTFVGGG